MLRYLFELGGAFLVYGASLFLATYLHSHWGISSLGAAFVPMPTTMLVAWVIWRNLRKMDEMQVRQQLEALGMAFALTGLVTFNYGFLEGAGLPRQSAFWVWVIMATSWVITQGIVKLRYR